MFYRNGESKVRNGQAEERLAKTNRRVGELFDGLAQGLVPKGLEKGQVTSVSLRLATEQHPEALCVIKATDAKGKHIAFVGGLDIVQALLTWRARETGPGLKWRDDVPWEQR